MLYPRSPQRPQAYRVLPVSARQYVISGPRSGSTRLVRTVLARLPRAQAANR